MPSKLSPFIVLFAHLLVFTSAGDVGGDWFLPQDLSTNVMAKAVALILHLPEPPAPLPPLEVNLSPPDPDLPRLHVEHSPPEPEPPHLHVDTSLPAPDLPPLQIDSFPLQPDLPPLDVWCHTGHSHDSRLATPPDMILSASISITGLPGGDNNAETLKKAIEDSCIATNLATYEPLPNLEKGKLVVKLQIIVTLGIEDENHAPPFCVDYAMRKFNPDFQWCSETGW